MNLITLALFLFPTGLIGQTSSVPPAGSGLKPSQPRPTVVAGAKYRIVSRWEFTRLPWASVIVSVPVSDRDFIAIARELHQKYPAVRFEFFNHLSRPERIKIYERQIITNEGDPFADGWMEKHHLGRINRMSYSRTEHRWQLLAGFSKARPMDPITELE